MVNKVPDIYFIKLLLMLPKLVMNIVNKLSDIFLRLLSMLPGYKFFFK